MWKGQTARYHIPEPVATLGGKDPLKVPNAANLAIRMNIPGNGMPLTAATIMETPKMGRGMGEDHEELMSDFLIHYCRLRHRLHRLGASFIDYIIITTCQFP